MTIKNLIFDFGKVLVDYDFRAFLLSITKDEQRTDEFFRLLSDEDFLTESDLGIIPFPQLIANMQQEFPQWHDELQEFIDRHIDAMTGEVSGMRDVLVRMRERGYKMYGLTNWSCAVYEVIEKYDILRMMDGTVISSEEKLIKPDVAIYKRLCRRYGLKPEECLFTDDRPVNVEGAKKAGMHAIVFTSAAQYEKDAEYILSLNKI